MTPEDVLQEIEHQAGSPPSWGIHSQTTHFLPIIGRKKGAVLEQMVKEQKPQLILEVGTLVGYSAILMAQHLVKGKIITVEKDPVAAKKAQENISKAGLASVVDIHRGDALDIIPTLDGRFDLVFIDAHKEDYLRYLQLAEPKLNPQAVIIADNVKFFAKEVDDYLQYVRRSGKFTSTTHDFGSDAVEVSTLK